MMYTITVHPNELDLIGAGLREMPYKVSAPLLEKLKLQAAQQEHEAAQRAADEREASKEAA